MKLERAKMRVRVSVGAKEAKANHEKLKALYSEVELEDWDEGALEMASPRERRESFVARRVY